MVLPVGPLGATGAHAAKPGERKFHWTVGFMRSWRGTLQPNFSSSPFSNCLPRRPRPHCSAVKRKSRRLLLVAFDTSLSVFCPRLVPVCALLFLRVWRNVTNEHERRKRCCSSPSSLTISEVPFGGCGVCRCTVRAHCLMAPLSSSLLASVRCSWIWRL